MGKITEVIEQDNIVRITDVDHPHYSEMGAVHVEENGSVLLENGMFKIDLINSKTGVESCYVRPSQVAIAGGFDMSGGISQ